MVLLGDGVSVDEFADLFDRFIDYHRKHVYPKVFEKILDYDKEFMRERLARILEDARRSNDVLMIFEKRDSKLVAFCWASTEDYWAGGKLLDIVALHVREGYRGQGIGSKMIEEVLEWGRERGVRVVTVHIGFGNEPARRLFEKYGFRVFNIEFKREM